MRQRVCHFLILAWRKEGFTARRILRSLKDWLRKKVEAVLWDEIEEENQLLISEKKKAMERDSRLPENAAHSELDEYITESEIQLKVKQLSNSM